MNIPDEATAACARPGAFCARDAYAAGAAAERERLSREFDAFAMNSGHLTGATVIRHVRVLLDGAP